MSFKYLLGRELIQCLDKISNVKYLASPTKLNYSIVVSNGCLSVELIKEDKLRS